MRAHENPLRTECLHRLAFRAKDFTWPVFLNNLDRCGDRGLIVGPKGSGKTTLIGDLLERLRSRGQSVHSVRLDPDSEDRVQEQLATILRGAKDHQMVLVDGSDRIDALTWWQFRRRLPQSSGLVLTAHREGRLPTLHRCQPSLAIFRELVLELMSPEIADQFEIDEVYRRHGGNMRSSFLELYDSLAEARASL